MKLSDIVAQYLARMGIKIIFGYQGGAITHMIDSFDRAGIQYIQNYNEQGASFAADAYSRVSEKSIGVAIGTNGPGATNMITGIADAYCDSIPVLFITGQVHTFAMKSSSDIRQESFQEIDIISMVKSVVKYACTVMRPEDALPNLAKAIRIAKSDRPGPVLIDLPVDVQGIDLPIIDFDDYYNKIEAAAEKEMQHVQTVKSKDIIYVAERLQQAKQPVILIGGGVRCGDAVPIVRKFVEKTKIPVVVSLMGIDSLNHYEEEFIGFIGGYGNRYANIAIQNADCILVLGSRLDGRQTGKRRDLFATRGEVIHIDIDKLELGHFITNETKINADIYDFITELSKTDFNININTLNVWKTKIRKWKNSFPDNKEMDCKTGLNPNEVIKRIGKELEGRIIVCSDVGQNQMWVAQSLRINSDNVRILNSGGLGAMGFSLPAAIGAYYAAPESKVIAFMGDGGFQMNIQELQVISQHQLPIDIIVMNNHALGLIREVHEKYYNSRCIGSVAGFSMPDLKKISEAYNLEYHKITELDDIENLFGVNTNIKPRLIDVEFSGNTYIRPELLNNDGLDHQQPYKEYEHDEK